jgi:hypothetical protein
MACPRVRDGTYGTYGAYGAYGAYGTDGSYLMQMRLRRNL